MGWGWFRIQNLTTRVSLFTRLHKIQVTRQIHEFDVPVAPSTSSDLCHPDKHLLRATILAMREQGMSYRQIGKALGIHWTRVGQIIRDEINIPVAFGLEIGQTEAAPLE